MKRLLFAAVFLLLTACSNFQPQPATETPFPTDEVDLPEASPTAVPVIPPDNFGEVSGRVCYPSEFIPEMTVYFLDVNTQMYYHFLIVENQEMYSVELPVGTYKAFGWRADVQLGGGYSAYVACGFAESCTDHALLEVSVTAGSSVEDIDICDWVLTDLPLPDDAQLPVTELAPLSGLVYRNPDGLWLVEPSGSQRLIQNNPDAMVLSATQTAYIEGDDLWLYDTDTGQSTNLTHTPDRVETIWTGNKHPEGAILFSSYPVDFELGPGVTGFLTIVNLDGTGYTILDEETQVWHFDLSPDGKRVAYGLGQTGMIYNLETGERSELAASDYGLEGVNSMGSPAWSPAGDRISWVVGYQPADGERFTFGAAVFDLAAGSAILLHPHEIPGMDGYPPAPVWRPDGEWLVYTAYDLDFEKSGLWLLRADGSAEIYLGPGGAVVWRPDGGALVFQDSSNGGMNILDTVSLQSSTLDFTDKNSIPAAWLP